jgi:hypothetical protein
VLYFIERRKGRCSLLKKTFKSRPIAVILASAVVASLLVSCSLGTGISIPLYTELGGQSLVTYTDPAGDTFGFMAFQYDIISVDVFRDRQDAYLIMHITFNNPVLPPTTPGAVDELVGYLEIDADQNPTTGNLSVIDSYASGQGLPPAHLGVEYSIYLFDYDPLFQTFSVYEENMYTLSGYARALFNDNSVTLQIPLAALGNDDGNVNFGFILGTFPEPTDMAYYEEPSEGNIETYSYPKN